MALLPRINAHDAYSSSISSSYYVEDGSYLRAWTVQLGYTLPAALGHRVGAQHLRLYLQGQNLFILTHYTGLDPEAAQ